jgi:flagellar protein FlaJ
MMASLTQSLEKALSNYIYVSGLRVHPTQYVKRVLTMLIASAAVTAFLLYFSFFIAGVPAFAIIGVMPLSYSLYLMFRPVVKARSFESQCMRELPYVAAFMTSYAAVGVPPHRSMAAVGMKEKIFPAFSSLVKRMETTRMLTVKDPLEAIEDEADKISSLSLKDYLQSAVSAERGGGGMYNVLKDKMRSLFNDLKERYKALGDQLKLYGDLLLVFFGVLPLLLYTMLTVFASDAAISTSQLFTFMVTPLLVVTLMMLIDTGYPATPQKFDKYYVRAVMVGLPAGVAVAAILYLSPVLVEMLLGARFIQYKMAVSIGAGLVVFSALATYVFIRDYRFMNNVDYAIPSFVRDLTEEVKKGKSPAMGVIYLAEARSYNKAFNDVLRQMALILKTGRGFREAVAPFRGRVSWRSQLILDLLADADELGAQKEIFEEVSGISREIRDAINIAKAKTTGVKFFGFLVAILMIFIASLLIKQIIVPLAMMAVNIPQQVGLGNINLLRPEQLPTLIETISSGIMLNAFFLGVLTGKMSDGIMAAGFLYAFLYSLAGLAAMFFLF